MGMATILNPFVKLPDEVTLGVSFIAGVAARKGAEYQMQKYLEAHPDLPV